MRQKAKPELTCDLKSAVRITLKNGLPVNVVHLRLGKLDKLRTAYQNHLRQYGLEQEMMPKAYARHCLMTFRFKKTALRAIFCETMTRRVLDALKSENPEAALDCCMGVFVDEKLVYATFPEYDVYGNLMQVWSDPVTAFDPVIRAMKQAVANNVSPNVAPLVYLKE